MRIQLESKVFVCPKRVRCVVLLKTDPTTNHSWHPDRTGQTCRIKFSNILLTLRFHCSYHNFTIKRFADPKLLIRRRTCFQSAPLHLSTSATHCTSSSITVYSLCFKLHRSIISSTTYCPRDSHSLRLLVFYGQQHDYYVRSERHSMLQRLVRVLVELTA